MFMHNAVIKEATSEISIRGMTPIVFKLYIKGFTRLIEHGASMYS